MRDLNEGQQSQQRKADDGDRKGSWPFAVSLLEASLESGKHGRTSKDTQISMHQRHEGHRAGRNFHFVT